ncbi:MAG: hypothetical protein AAGH65_09705 [Pseudomonadota bacterium]
MSRMTRIGVTLVCLFLALASYAVGIPAGSLVFILLGVGFELLFWIGLFGSADKAKRDA